MTPPSRPALPAPDSISIEEVLDELRETTDAAVGKASAAITGLTPEQEAGAKRGHRVQEDKAWAEMRVTCIKALPWIIVPVLVLVILAGMLIAGVWVYGQATDAAKLDKLVSTALATAAGAALTFLGQQVFQSKRGE